ncbi:hypothetical protein [Roseateles asaccharophilus]|uniref:Mannitol repressor n=1 Tax=Roseateles asaccharophilus TaxID=582607 RepID=A0ABU2AD67_9BURK|nr:hypothetical protein [Roseateles asaccharophilus]MDR7335130.1 hypothetical protein [Roseateles asaccharophilus]
MSKPETTATKQTRSERVAHWNNVFVKEFGRESDRAAVIVAASIFDSSLDSLLRQYLVPCSSSNDDLFDGTNAPLSTFSAKIAMAHRLGLITTKFCRNLHLIRRIRNEFAHNIHGGSFEDTAVKARVRELNKGQIYEEPDSDIRRDLPPGPRGDFLCVCLWMLWCLSAITEKTRPLSEPDLEFGFVFTTKDAGTSDSKNKAD